MKKKNEELLQQSTAKNNKTACFNYTENNQEVVVYDEDLKDELVDINIKANPKKLAEIIMWSINTIGQLNTDPETITLKRRTQQINQLDNALSILQNQALELLKSELSPKAVLKTTNITKE